MEIRIFLYDIALRRLLLNLNVNFSPSSPVGKNVFRVIASIFPNMFCEYRSDFRRAPYFIMHQLDICSPLSSLAMHKKKQHTKRI